MKRVFAFIGFTVAITLFMLNLIPNITYYAAGCAVAFLIASLLVKPLRKAKVVPVIMCSIIFACVIFGLNVNMKLAPQLSLDKTSAESTFSIVDIYSEDDNGYYCYTVKASSVNAEGAPQNFNLRLKSKNQLEADFYDNITGRLYFSKIGDNAFNSYGYYGDEIFLSARLISSYSVESPAKKPLNYNIIRQRIKIKNLLNDTFGGDVGALAASILIGDKSDLSDEAYSNFKICGVSHAIVVSGLHTSLVCMGVYLLLKLLKAPKPTAVIVTLLCTLFYIALADFSKSALRAGIMVSVLLIAKLFKHKADSLNSLGIAVFIICLNPFAVCDVGACLSVTAVLGILVIYPKLCVFGKNMPKPFGFIINSILLTCSVILSTLPIMCIYFKSVSLVGIILNILFVPILQLALGSVLLFTVLCNIPFLAFLPRLTAKLSLSLMLWLTDLFARHLSWLRIDIYGNYLLVGIAACFIVMGLVLIINRELSLKMTAAFVCLSLVFSFGYSAYKSSNTVSVKLLSSGAVVVEDRDTLVGAYVKDYGDFCEIKSNYGDERAGLFISCDEYSGEIAEIYGKAYFVDNSKSSYLSVDEKINLAVSKEKLVFYIYGNIVEISENNVIINGTEFNRSSDYVSESNITLYFEKDEISLRREERG
ncbi:MAG: ComEC/Rec2 family competence protein [Eubacterium sp.]